MGTNLNIVVAPNEDGFGTSAWVVMIAKELSRNPSVAGVKVIIATEKRRIFHSDKYLDDQKITLISLQGQGNRLEIPKIGGAVDVGGTIEQCILSYPASRKDYATALADQGVIDEADLVIDWGVPQLVSAAREKNTVTVFDHAWSMSLERIISGNSAKAFELPSIAQSLEEMRNDEALTQHIILFGEPICPVDYHNYWKRLLGQEPQFIPGVLGGPLRTLAYAHDPIYETIRSSLIDIIHTEPSEATYDRARKYAKQIVGIEEGNSEPTLFMSGGGTSVWDDALSKMLDEYQTKNPDYNVIIFNPSEASKRGIKLTTETVHFNGTTRTIKRATWEKCKKVTFIDTLEGETHHVLFAAFDLVLTRAGGGTVNNAIAFRVPLVLVEEPGMWQVEQIRVACERMGIASGIPFTFFIQQGRKCVETESGELLDLSSQRDAMKTVPSHGEFWLSRSLLGLAQTG